MRFISICAAALSMFASFAAAQSEGTQNPIIFPGTNSTLSAGQTYEITWKPTTTGTSINLALRYGPQRNLIASSVIAVAVENDGSATWVVPSGIGNGQWTIEIVDSAGNVNYSPLFYVVGGTGKQGAAAVTSTLVASTATNTPTLTGALPTQFVTKTNTVTTGAASAATGAAVNVAGHGMAAVLGLGALVAMA